MSTQNPGAASGSVLRGLVLSGLVAAVVAMVVTTAAAAIAQALDVDFELPDGGDSIPLPGFATITGVASLVGIAVAAAFRRWSAHPAQNFLRTTVALTVISLVAPLLAGANAGTTIALLVLHVIPAAIVIPALTRALRSLET